LTINDANLSNLNYTVHEKSKWVIYCMLHPVGLRHYAINDHVSYYKL